MGFGLYRNMQPHSPKWLLEALRLHPNKTGHRRPPPVCSAAASSFSRSRLFRVACRGARSALACGCCWRVSVSDVVFMFSVELNFRLLGVFLCGWQPADPQATRPAGESVVIPISRSFYFRSAYVNRAAWGPFATVTRPSSAFS